MSFQKIICNNLISRATQFTETVGLAKTVGLACVLGLCIEHIWTRWPTQPKILSTEEQMEIQRQRDNSLQEITPFLDRFIQAIKSNNLENVGSIVKGIKKIPVDENAQCKPLIPLPWIHAKIVDTLNHANSEAAKAMRKQLADFYFQPIAGVQKPIQWLSQKETIEAYPIDFTNRKKCLEAFYYHATGFQGLKGILTDKAINVTTKQAYFGAFVATDPESQYGSHLIVLKKTIERQSPPSSFFNALSAFGQSYTWVGFSEKISVNDDTLAYIAVERDVNIPNDAQKELHLSWSMDQKERVNLYCIWLIQKCKEWTGREILVIPSSRARQYRAQVKEMRQGIPKEWGRGGFANRMPTGRVQNSNSVLSPSKGMTQPLSIINRLWIALNRLIILGVVAMRPKITADTQ